MRTLPTLLFLFTVVGCGGDDDAAGPDAGDAPDADPGRAHAGSIRVIEQRSVYDDGGGTPTTYRSSATQASFHVGGAPRFHREAMRDGACVLHTYTPSSCTPACTDGLCVDTDVCEPWGTLASAGRLTVAGLTVAVAIDPASGYYYPQAQLPEDLFADDATVTATLAGDEIGAATLTAGGVRPIVTAFEAGELDVPYPAGGDVAVRWTPAGDGSRVKVTINANNQGHGMPYLAILTCDVADADGEVQLPEAMLDAFPATEAWTICAGTDCPRSTITRYQRDAVPVGDDLELELIVGSTFDFGVNHPRP